MWYDTGTLLIQQLNIKFNVYHKQFFFNDGTQAPDLANYVFTTRAIKQIYLYKDKVKPLFSRHFDFKKFGTMLYFPPAHLYSQRMRTNSYAPEEEFGVTKTTKNKKSSVMITDTSKFGDPK